MFFKKKKTPNKQQRSYIMSSKGSDFSIFASSLGTSPLGKQSSFIDEVFANNYYKLIDKARHTSLNNDYVKRYLSLCVNNILGEHGILLQAKVQDVLSDKLDNIANKSIEQAWQSWNEDCDITGLNCFVDIQRLALQSVIRDGEFLLRLHFGVGDFGLKLELLDPSTIALNVNIAGKNIVNGIEYDKYGQAQAYYLRDDLYGSQVKRIKADEIVFGFLSNYPSQKRGLSWLGSSLDRLEKLSNFEDYALKNAQISASITGFLTNKNREQSDLTGDNGEQTPSHEEKIDVQVGSMMMLEENVDVKKISNDFPANIEQMVQIFLKGASAGLGISYHSLSGDLTQVNYSSIRQGTLEDRDEWKSKQQWFIRNFHKKIYINWLLYALTSGAIKHAISGTAFSMDKFRRFKRVSWLARRWSYIDPAKEMKAKLIAAQLGIVSKQSMIREMGQDPDDVLKEIKEYKKGTYKI